MNDLRIKICIFLFVILFVISCDKEVCYVGDTKITKKDLFYRIEVSSIYYPGNKYEYAALSQLIKGYLSEEVLLRLGHKIDDNVIKGEEERIDKNTKAPEILDKIKKVYGRDKQAYYRTFVRVVYAERVLYNDIFLRSYTIHKGEYDKAKKIIDRIVNNGEEINKIAGDMGLKVNRLSLTKEGIKSISDSKEEAVNEKERRGSEIGKYIMSLISGVQEGEVYREVVEMLEGYQVVKVIKKGSEEVVVDTVGIPKRDYDEWFWEIAGKIPVKVVDDKLRDEFIREVGWAKRLNMK